MGELRTRPTQGQRSLWVMDQMAPGSSAYNIAFAARVMGHIDPEALRRAADRLVERHEALRTTLREERGGLVAVVHDVLRPTFAILPPTDDVSVAVHRAHHAPFSLTDGPLVRLTLQPDGSDTILALTAHHAVADFQSLEILLDDLGRLYTAERGGAAASLPEPTQFVDAVSDISAPPPALKAARDYWSARLADPPPPLRWPVRAPGSSDTTSRFFSLDPALTRRLRAFCVESGASIFAAVVASWTATLARVTGQAEWLVGVPTSTRPPGHADCVGFFVNPIPLRLRVDPERSFAAHVADALRETLTAVEHRIIPFTEIVDLAGAPRLPGRNPLFQTMVGVHQPRRFPGAGGLYLVDDAKASPVEWGELRLEPFRLAQQEGQVDLSLELADEGERIRGVVRCRTEIVPASALDPLIQHLCALLSQMLLSPDALTGALSATDDAPELGAIPSAPLLPPPTDDIVARFSCAALANPDQTAVTDGEVTETYASLDLSTARIARHLRTHGITAGERVGVALEPSARGVSAMLGIMRAGASYVPLDPALPPERLRRTLKQAAIRFVFTGNMPVELPDGVESVTLDALDRDDGAALPLPGPDALAYTLFTSGSTGEPKGIDVRHGGVVSLFDAMLPWLDTAPGDRWSWFHAPSFDLSIWEIWGALCSGGTVVVVPRDVRARPDAFVALLERERVTIATQTPSALRLLADELDRRGLVALHLRHVISCGEILPGAVARRLFDRGFTLWNLYGPAEATVYATIERVDAAAAAFEGVPIGVPLQHDAIAILDERGRPTPAGAVGELWIGGHGIAAGYVALPEQTAAKFVERAGGRWYRTGDLAAWDGQRIQFLGRRDHQVKVRGYRIELGDVEAALRELPSVSDAAVIVESLPHGEELAAVVVPRDPSQPPSEASLRHAVATLLPQYMVPSRIEVAPDLPLNAHGKIQRSAVRARLPSRATAVTSASDDPTERSLANLWGAVLGRDEISVEEGFFELGGNSIALMRVFAGLVDIPGAQSLTPTDLFRYPTVRALAARIRGGSPSPARDVGRGRLDGVARLARRRSRD